MSRRRRIQKRRVMPDPVYHNDSGDQFHQRSPAAGQTQRRREHFLLLHGDHRVQDGPAKGSRCFIKALDNSKPVVEVKSRRVGGATYQVPVEIRQDRSRPWRIRWIIGYAKARAEKTMAEKLAGEFVAAAKNEGSTIKKKEDTHRMAEANKAFAHFRW